MVALAATSLVLVGLANSITTIIDAQRAQLAADSAALACVIYGQDSAQQATNQNGAELVSVVVTVDQCQVTASYHEVVRTAFALTSRAEDLRTLQS